MVILYVAIFVFTVFSHNPVSIGDLYTELGTGVTGLRDRQGVLQ